MTRVCRSRSRHQGLHGTETGLKTLWLWAISFVFPVGKPNASNALGKRSHLVVAIV
jgi:hypothetical protein